MPLSQDQHNQQQRLRHIQSRLCLLRSPPEDRPARPLAIFVNGSNCGPLEQTTPTKSKSAAQQAIELDGVFCFRALNLPSQLPSFLVGDDASISFEKGRFGVVHVCLKETDPATGETKQTRFIERAWDSYHSKDPQERFASLVVAADVSMMRGMLSGAPEAETELMRSLVSYLQDKAEGKSNHPAEPTKRSVGKAEVAARAYAALASLVDLKGKIDGCQRLKACSRAAWHVDEMLEGRGVSLANWLPGAGKSHLDENERIHPYATRIKRWFDDGVFPERDLPAFEEERRLHERAIEACGGNENLASYYVVLLRHAADLVIQNIRPKAA